MPTKHVIKIYAEDAFYHVFNRGVNKENIFNDKYDYSVFLNLFKRHLGFNPVNDKIGRPYDHMKDEIELLAYCLMPNHFHLFFYQKKRDAITKLMRRVASSYSMYFNNRHKRVGSVFQGTYKATLINKEDYLWHISRYIHLNPLDIEKNYQSYPYSSYLDYIKKRKTEWLRPGRILAMHNESGEDYESFVANFVSYRNDIKRSKLELANL